jgi:hypothetical protein
MPRRSSRPESVAQSSPRTEALPPAEDHADPDLRLQQDHAPGPGGPGAALDENLTLHSTLCRREAGAFQQAIRGGETWWSPAPRKSACSASWAADRRRRLAPSASSTSARPAAGAATRAAPCPSWPRCWPPRKLPEPEPVPTVTYKSAGRLLVIGPLEAGERVAALSPATRWTSPSSRAAAAARRSAATRAGRPHRQLTGWLGAFRSVGAGQPDRPGPVHALQCLRGRLPGRRHRPRLPGRPAAARATAPA